MTMRLALLCVLALSLSACSSTSDRYAFWRDEGAPQGGTKPNLADVPAGPNVDAAKAEMESMRQRLEQDRQNAYLAAQGITPIEQNGTDTINGDNAHFEAAVSDEMAPAATSAYNQGQNLPPVSNAHQYNSGSTVIGNVQYNYAALDQQPYVYGHSRVQTAQAMQQQATSPAVSSDGSVSIDWSALDSSNAGSYNETAISSVGVSGQPAIYFKHGSSRLGANDKAMLRQIAQTAQQRAVSVVIVGHASKRTGLSDAATAREVNLRMSAKRAGAVMHELSRQGVSVDSIRVNAVGDSDAGNEAQDRRVDILFNN